MKSTLALDESAHGQRRCHTSMSCVAVSQMIDKEIARPVTKSDPKLNAIPHIMTRRFISLIHRAAEPPYRSKTGTHFA